MRTIVLPSGGGIVNCAIFVLVAFCETSTAQSVAWTPTDGPYGGGFVSAVAVDSTGRIYRADIDNGTTIYVSSDEGTHWTRSGSLPTQVMAMGIKSNGTILAGTWEGVFSSTDQGATWLPRNSGLTTTYITCFTLTPWGDVFVGNNIYATGLFTSSDEGASWSPAGFEGQKIWCLSSDRFGRLFVSADSGVFRSTDRGQSWTEAQGVSFARSFATADPDIIIAGANHGPVFRSADGGLTWEASSSGLPSFSQLSAIVFSGKDGAVFVFVDPYGIFLYSSASDSWSRVDWRSAWTHARGFNESPTGTILLATENLGVLRSTDRGLTWHAANYGVRSARVHTLLATTAGYIFAGTQAGVFRSAMTEEVSWSQVDTGFVPHSTYSFLVDADQGLIAGAYGVFFSENHGLGWRSSSLSGTILALVQARTSPLFAVRRYISISPPGAHGDIFRSTDSGRTWTMVWNGNEGSNVIQCITIDGENNLYAAGNRGIIRSGNFGTTWQSLSSFGRSSRTIAFGSDGSMYASTVKNDYTGEPYGLMKSTDAGITWHRVLILDTDVSGILTDSQHNLYVSTLGQGISYSADVGETWRVINTGLRDSTVYSIAINEDGYLFAGTESGGVYKTINTVTSVDKVDQLTPVEFSLHQNYPNPFNPTTEIRYQIPEAGHVTLKVYDVLGREVATLVEGEVPAGVHRVSWDASGLPTGIYLYRLSTNSYVETRRMLLLK